jgi:hypothetical protein
MDTRICRLRQYTEYVQEHLPIRSLNHVSENELRMEIALPSGGHTTLSVVFHPLTGKLAKAEVRSISTPEIYTKAFSEYSGYRLHSSSTPQYSSTMSSSVDMCRRMILSSSSMLYGSDYPCRGEFACSRPVCCICTSFVPRLD